MSHPSPDVKAVVRAAEALTTQVRRIADALSTPVVRYEVAADDAPTTDDDALRRMLTNALTAEHYRRAREQIVASPEEHSAAMADVVMHVLRVVVDNGATQTTLVVCDQTGPWGEAHRCIRPLGHSDDHEALDGCGWREPDWISRGTRDLSIPEQRTATDDDEAVAPTCWHTEPGSPCDWDRCRQPERLAAGDPGTDPATTPPLGPKLRAAADEETSPGERRRSLAVLLSRAQRGVTPLTSDEATLLRRHVEVEIREANTARSVAAGNKRHVQVMYGELTAAQAAIERARAECAAIAREVYGQHDEDDDGKREAVGRVIAALDGTEQPTTEA